ncbi:hypothetical protein F4775DRAFT_575842 [Biscogniauxia sp. FL1348]|nr:hypothetical protein F4775DRAFT_575842 [Biscogniauxia sp. FL1348]
MDKPGSNATLQDKPYPHGTATDPAGKFLAVLDCGADALRAGVLRRVRQPVSRP